MSTIHERISPEPDFNPHWRSNEEEQLGHKIEKMVISYLSEIPEIKSVRSTSRFDDEKEHVDMIICLENGKEIAIDITTNDELAELMDKIKKIMRHPILSAEHNDKGSIVSELNAPKAIAGVDIKRWAKVYGDTDGDPDLIRTAKELIGEEEAILTRVRNSLEHLRGLNIPYRGVYNDRIAAIDATLSAIRVRKESD